MNVQPAIGTWQERLDFALSRALKRVEGSDPSAINDLASVLGPLYDEASADGGLQAFKRCCATSDLYPLLSSDPYTSRARKKPRGYAGDAPMLDYIYRPIPRPLEDLANLVHQATTSSSNAESIIWRRNYLAGRIVQTLGRSRSRILSVASGHMRELDVVRVATRSRNMHLTALDQDGESLRQCATDYSDFDISPVCETIMTILRKKSALGQFDLVYSAGLFDYLNDRTASALAQALIGHVRPGGSLLIGNFHPQNHGRGFMEGFMGWSLILRDERQMESLVPSVVEVNAKQSFCDDAGNVAYLEIKL
jgi:extracellular factor (EF) 3-hydroxypalmitic acid methyl ester biosynthesis protein